jgi:hypothetical protein
MDELKTRMELPRLIDELGLKIGAEIGVNTGDFSDHLLTNSKLDKLFSIDAWTTDTTQTKSVFKDWATCHGEVEKAYDEARLKLSRHGPRSQILRELSYTAIEHFDDGGLDFLYVDGCHRFTGVAMDLIQWWPKIREGGVLAGHDYWRCYRCEVMDAVNGFVVEHKQILHLTTEDKAWNGRDHYPPTFWLVKKPRTKKEWMADLPEARARLLNDQEKLRAKRVEIVLPYQYVNLQG